MQKISFDNVDIEKNKQLKKNLADKLLNNSYIKSLIAKKAITEQQVMTEPYLFLDLINNLQLCVNCKGLNECRQNVLGNHYDIVNDYYLELQLAPCKYMINQIASNKYLGNIIYNHMAKSNYDITIDKLVLDNENKDYLMIVHKLDKWLNNPSFPGYYLVGDVGVGKTYLSCCAINEMAKKGYRVGFINVSKFVNEIKEKISERINYTSDIQKISNLDFLVFDDIGAETITPWVRDELLFPILNHRMENQKWTWFTSNDNFDTLYTRYSKCNCNADDNIKARRFMERIRVLANQVVLTGNNRRK